MRIHIDALEVSCIIGLLDFEREAEQKVLLAVEIDYHYQEKAFLDYGHIAAKIKQHLRVEKYVLLEDALLGIKTMLFAQFPAILRLRIKLTKPDILDYCTVGLSEEWINTPQ